MSFTANLSRAGTTPATRPIEENTPDTTHTELRNLDRAYSRQTEGEVIHETPPAVAPDVVDRHGLDDTDHPWNWPSRKKWTQIACVSMISFLTPFGSSMFASGVPQVMEEFKSDNVDLASFVVSVYILGYAFGPLVIAPMSELYGRLPVYHISTTLFLVFNIACALSTGLHMLVVFRFLAGMAGATPMTIGSASIADMFKQEQRGMMISIWMVPLNLGPSLGPVIGGYLSVAVGWRWIFWLLAICTGALLLVALIFQVETYPPILLERKVERLQQETGNESLRLILRSGKSPKELFLLSVIRPTKMLFLSPIIFGLSLYIAVGYGYMYMLIATMTFVFRDEYGFSASSAGLVFLGMGVGNLIGLLGFGAFSDRYLIKLAKGGELRPEYRLPLLWPGAIMLPSGIILYGWTAQYRVHFIVPVIGSSLLGLGMISLWMPVQTYLVDAFTIYAASAMAANTLLRSLGGSLLPLAGRRLYNTLGLGWGNTLLGLIALGMVPMIWIFLKYGETIRTHPKFQLNL